VASGDTERVVKLKSALAAALQVASEIFARRWEVVAVRCAGRRLRIDQFAKPFLGLAPRDHDLPRLAVAPGRRALCHGENVRDGLARNLSRQEGANRIALV